ncbi:ATP-grasp domain-containing protein [Hyphobacterium sp.]|uniref:ATP-grasp domain-containing protein n=1 Tax=Hyphobacterium sp. TaxID=2004662 RepID=UPI003BACA148
MRRIAFLTAACMIEGLPEARTDAWEHTLEFAALQPACRLRAISLEAVIWDDPGFDPEAFEAIIVGTCWDYMEKPEAFLSALDRFARLRPLLNPLATIRWNSDKGYLRDLETEGVPTIPTLWADRADDDTLLAAFEALDAEDIVAKPRIGASAWRQVRLRKGGPLPPVEERPPAACLIQPFLKAAETEGEMTLLFFDRVFSHGLVKRPRHGDYRTQSMYGANETATDPPADALEVAQAALDAVEGALLYARVDLMRGADRGWKVMELELIEPYFYPEQGPFLGAHFAASLDRLLAA